MTKELEITRNTSPALIITGKEVALIFDKSEVKEYPFHIEGRKEHRCMVVIPQKVFEEWIKDEYKELMEN